MRAGPKTTTSVVAPAAIRTIVIAARPVVAGPAPAAAIIAAHPHAPADVSHVLGEVGVFNGGPQARRRAERHGLGAVGGQRGRRQDRQSSGDREYNSTHSVPPGHSCGASRGRACPERDGYHHVRVGNVIAAIRTYRVWRVHPLFIGPGRITQSAWVNS